MRRLTQVLVAAVLAAVAPKCALCLYGYVGAGAVLGWGGPEVCGSLASPSALTALGSAMAGSAVATAGWWLHQRRARRREGQPARSPSGRRTPPLYKDGTGPEGGFRLARGCRPR